MKLGFKRYSVSEVGVLRIRPMHAINVCGEWTFNITLSLTLALKQETCQLHALVVLTTEERATTVHGIGNSVYLRSCVVGLEER
jgi:hypothetical protein